MGCTNLSRSVVLLNDFPKTRCTIRSAVNAVKQRYFTRATHALRFLLMLFLFCFYRISLHAQFTDMAPLMDITYESDFGYAVGVSSYDFNKDGWDDLTICTNNHGIKTFQNNDGLLEEVFLFDLPMSMYRTPTWVDLDNDGDADFFATGYMNECVLFRNDGEAGFTNLTSQLNLPIWDARSYGCSWGDYDNDSFLDVYISNYYMNGAITNWLLHNNGDFTFTEVAQELMVDNGVKTTYQSSFFDYDIDGDADLFVTNDRSYGNALYRNNGDGTFEDVSVETNTGTIMEAMCTSFSDFDDDGDFDFFVTNTDNGSVLLKNDNGVFNDVAADYNLQCLGTVSWGVAWLDYDNNSKEDVYVANVNVGDFNNDLNYFFMHQVDGTYSNFEAECFEQDTLRSYSVACGDFDNNGFEDFAVSNVWPASISLWENDATSANHWIKVGLTGTIGNRDAIGATIKTYCEGHMEMKQITCGESYLAQSSQYEIFGLGEMELVDSIQVYWPGGWIDTYYNLAANSLYTFTEGESFTDIVEQHTLLLCNGESLTIDAGSFASYEWNTGDVNAQIDVSVPGVFSVVVENEFGFQRLIEYTVNEFVPPVHYSQLVMPSCHGANDGAVNVNIASSQIVSIEWSNAQSGYNLTNLSADDYAFVILFDNGCQFSETITLAQPDPLNFYCLNDTICENEFASLDWNVQGGTAPYEILWNDLNPLVCAPGSFVVEARDANLCNTWVEFTIAIADPINVIVTHDPICFGELATLQFDMNNGQSVYQFDLDGINPNAVPAGNYSALVTDEFGCVSSIDFDVQESDALLVDLELIHTENGQNGALLLDVTGGVPPYSFLWNTNDESEDILNVPAGIYSCVITDAIGCTTMIQSELIDLSVQNINASFDVFPVPCADVMNINAKSTSLLVLYDLQGKIVLEKLIYPGLNVVDMKSLASNTYLLRLNDVSKLITKY